MWNTSVRRVGSRTGSLAQCRALQIHRWPSVGPIMMAVSQASSASCSNDSQASLGPCGIRKQHMLPVPLSLTRCRLSSGDSGPSMQGRRPQPRLARPPSEHGTSEDSVTGTSARTGDRGRRGSAAAAAAAAARACGAGGARKGSMVTVVAPEQTRRGLWHGPGDAAGAWRDGTAIGVHTDGVHTRAGRGVSGLSRKSAERSELLSGGGGPLPIEMEVDCGEFPSSGWLRNCRAASISPVHPPAPGKQGMVASATLRAGGS
mmetsp:Transcript_20677/g.62312  ORF Transcript_20677/g.62312 Transcript_20677/m.62312 type:complete len:260 (+) Transcript_20677:1379-2158(+)